MSSSRRPASAPSDLQNNTSEPNNDNDHHQGASRQWASTRGKRPELQKPQTGTSTLYVKEKNSRRSRERLPTAPLSPHDPAGPANSAPANQTSSSSHEANPWKRKTLLTLGILFRDSTCRGYTDTRTRWWWRKRLLKSPYTACTHDESSGAKARTPLRSIFRISLGSICVTGPITVKQKLDRSNKSLLTLSAMSLFRLYSWHKHWRVCKTFMGYLR